jgi:hypothetical protein
MNPGFMVTCASNSKMWKLHVKYNIRTCVADPKVFIVYSFLKKMNLGAKVYFGKNRLSVVTS